MTDAKYVLCRPIGGLNDSLCQVEHCRVHAELYGRTLIVDGKYSGIMGEFGDYFTMEGEGHIFSTLDPRMPDLDALDCLPAAVRGRVTTFDWKKAQTETGLIAVEAQSDAPLRFDLNTDHPEALVIHQQAGGGFNSLELLDRLTLVPELAERIRATIDALPQGYFALHIRNTDYKTDLTMVMEAMKKRMAGKDLLLCSDDPNVYALFKAGLPKARVHQITAMPFKDGRPLHVSARDKDAETRREVASNSLIELCALAGAARLFLPALHSQRTRAGLRVFNDRVKMSGFSVIAGHLARRKTRLRRLLGASGEGMLPGLDAGAVIRLEPNAA